MSWRNNQKSNHNTVFVLQFYPPVCKCYKNNDDKRNSRRRSWCVFLNSRLGPADWPCRWIIWKGCHALDSVLTVIKALIIACTTTRMHAHIHQVSVSDDFLTPRPHSCSGSGLNRSHFGVKSGHFNQSGKSRWPFISLKPTSIWPRARIAGCVSHPVDISVMCDQGKVAPQVEHNGIFPFIMPSAIRGVQYVSIFLYWLHLCKMAAEEKEIKRKLGASYLQSK